MSEFKEFDIGLILVFAIIFIFGSSQHIIIIYNKIRRAPEKKITKQDLERVISIQTKTGHQIPPGTLIQGRKLLYRYQFNDKLKEEVKKWLIENQWDISCGISDDVLWYWARNCLTEYYLADE